MIRQEATVTVEKRIRGYEFETVDIEGFGHHFFYLETPKIKARATRLLNKHSKNGVAKWVCLDEPAKGYSTRVWERHSGCRSYKVRIIWKIVKY